jgi:prophage regulatory protein
MKQLKIYRKKELCQLLGISSATLYRRIKEGTFPRSIKVSDNIVGWLAADLEDWFDNLVESQRPQ